jgi:hypothetical protein
MIEEEWRERKGEKGEKGDRKGEEGDFLLLSQTKM